MPSVVDSPPDWVHCHWFHDGLKKNGETSLPCRDDCQYCMGILHEGVSNKPLIQTCVGAEQMNLIKDLPKNTCKKYPTEKIQEINHNVTGTLFGKMIIEARNEKDEGQICTCSENWCNKNFSIETPTTIPDKPETPDPTSNPPETPDSTSNLPETSYSNSNPSTIKTGKIIMFIYIFIMLRLIC